MPLPPFWAIILSLRIFPLFFKIIFRCSTTFSIRWNSKTLTPTTVATIFFSFCQASLAYSDLLSLPLQTSLCTALIHSTTLNLSQTKLLYATLSSVWGSIHGWSASVSQGRKFPFSIPSWRLCTINTSGFWFLCRILLYIDALMVLVVVLPSGSCSFLYLWFLHTIDTFPPKSLKTSSASTPLFDSFIATTPYSQCIDWSLLWRI